MKLLDLLERITIALETLAKIEQTNKPNEKAELNMEMGMPNYEEIANEARESNEVRINNILENQTDKGFFEEDGLPPELVELM